MSDPKFSVVPNWIPRGDGLTAELEAQGVRIFADASTGKVYSTDPDLALQIAAAHDPLAHYLPLAVAKVNAEAQARIFAIMPAWKQTNTLALAMQNTMDFGADPTKWPADMQALAQIADAAWAKIKAIREASNQINATLAAETDWEKLSAYDPKYEVSWPK